MPLLREGISCFPWYADILTSEIVFDMVMTAHGSDDNNDGMHHIIQLSTQSICNMISWTSPGAFAVNFKKIFRFNLILYFSPIYTCFS